MIYRVKTMTENKVDVLKLAMCIDDDEDVKPFVKEFMMLLNVSLSLNTDINYHLIPVGNDRVIYIPVFKYTREEFDQSDEEIIRKRMDTIITFIRNTTFNDMGAECKHSLRNIFIHLNRTGKITTKDKGVKYKGYKLFRLYSTLLNEDISFNIDFKKVIELCSIHRYALKDGNKQRKSCITVLHDPYTVDYAIFCNLSKEFSEMTYQYNTLHLYEHLMTYAWRFTDPECSEAYVNGITSVNGISNIYSIVKSKKVLLRYMNSYIDMVLKGRNKTFWENEEDMLKRETMRTISETRTSRGFSNTSRSDPAAYDFNYNTDIFCKWANDAIDILLVCPEPLDVNKDLHIRDINKRIKEYDISKSAPSIKVNMFKYIPIEALSDKRYVHVERMDPREIAKNIMDNYCVIREGKMYGVDNCLIFPSEYTVDMDYRLYILLYLHRYLSKNEIQKYDEMMCRLIPMPYDYRMII